MRISKYINWNTLKMDSWIGAKFYILPSLSIFYDINSIEGKEYIKEITISLDIFCCTFNMYFRWNKHKELI